MRLTGGLDRGRKLRAPRGAATRPTSAKVREAIFNILGPPHDAAVLDLFAGTGALGIEALSRGAARAVFVEKGHRACEALRRNLRELKLAERAAIVPLDVRAALPKLALAGERFDWVFLDPPYAEGDTTAEILGGLADGDVLSPAGVIVVEHDKRHRPPESAGGLFRTDHRSYGDTELTFYRAARS